jgi:hypothetical protein
MLIWLQLRLHSENHPLKEPTDDDDGTFTGMAGHALRPIMALVCAISFMLAAVFRLRGCVRKLQ